MIASQQEGAPITLDQADTFADGIAVKHPGDLTYRLVSEYVDGIVTVTEDEIATAILALLEKQKVIAEGAGAVSVAAVLFHKLPIQGKKVVCIVSGGNIDVNILSRVITGACDSGLTPPSPLPWQTNPASCKRSLRSSPGAAPMWSRYTMTGETSTWPSTAAS